MKKKQLGKLTMAAAMLALAGTGATAGVMAVPGVCYATEGEGTELTITDTGSCLQVEGIGDFYYKSSSVGVILASYSGSATEIDLCKIFKGKKLTAIETGAFHENVALTTIKIPKTVQTIYGYDHYYYDSNDYYRQYGAFYGATHLTSVVFEEGSEQVTIGSGAFDGCTSLNRFPFEELTQLKTIQGGSFQNTALTAVTIPASCTTMGGGVSYESTSPFDGSQVTKITFVERGEAAITLPSKVFSGMTHLKEIALPKNVNYDPETQTSQISDYMFQKCSSLVKVTLPDNCGAIGESAFYGCGSLTQIDLPDACTSIGKSAFYDCSNLTELRISENSKLQSIGDSAFYENGNLKALAFPSGMKSIGAGALNGGAGFRSSLGTVLFRGVVEIQDDSFLTSGYAKNMIFLCEPNTRPEKYAQTKGYPYQRPVDSLAIEKVPTQTEYYYNDGLNWKDGLVLKAVWTSETETVGEPAEKKPTLLTMSPAQDSGMVDATTVFANAVVTGYNAKTVGNQDFVISYGGKTATFPVSVKYRMDSNEQVSNVSLAVSAQTYSGAEQKPELTVKNKVTGVALTAGTDYEVAYTNNINAGTATVTITGKGNYKGTISKTFAINPCDLSSEGITASVPDQTYTGKAIKPAASAVILKNGETALVAEADFDLADSNAYGNKNINASKNTACMTVVGTGNYKGNLKIPFVIKPKPMSEITLSEIPFNQEELQVRREDQEYDQDRLYLREAEKGQDLLCACPRV